MKEMYTIGIVGRAYKNKDGQDIIQTHEAVRKFLADKENVVCITILPTENKNYFDEIEPGTDIVNTNKIDCILDKCDAFIVPGGTYAYKLDEYVIKYAINKDKPLLAICLGFQIMCSMFAKNRTRFDMTERLDNDSHSGNHSEYKHKVILKSESKLGRMMNAQEIDVNSHHHDVVKFEMDTLLVNAIADDGIIEGVEYPGKKFIVGVQWHPEYLTDQYTQILIDNFMKSLEQ